MTTTPEHAGAVERLTEWADGWPHWKCTDEVVDAIKSALASLSRADARVLELAGVLEPFARFNLDGFNSIMLEVVPASPDNPSRRIEPILADHFRRARSALNATSPGMGSGDNASLVSNAPSGFARRVPASEEP